MKDLIYKFDTMMYDNFTHNYIPPKENHALVNALINLYSYDEEQENFIDGNNTVCFLSYF